MFLLHRNEAEFGRWRYYSRERATDKANSFHCYAQFRRCMDLIHDGPDTSSHTRFSNSGVLLYQVGHA